MGLYRRLVAAMAQGGNPPNTPSAGSDDPAPEPPTTPAAAPDPAPPPAAPAFDAGALEDLAKQVAELAGQLKGDRELLAKGTARLDAFERGIEHFHAIAEEFATPYPDQPQVPDESDDPVGQGQREQDLAAVRALDPDVRIEDDTTLPLHVCGAGCARHGTGPDGQAGQAPLRRLGPDSAAAPAPVGPPARVDPTTEHDAGSAHRALEWFQSLLDEDIDPRALHSLIDEHHRLGWIDDADHAWLRNLAAGVCPPAAGARLADFVADPHRVTALHRTSLAALERVWREPLTDEAMRALDASVDRLFNDR